MVKTYVTEYDNNEYKDNEQVDSRNVVSIWNNKKISNLGYVLDFLNTKVGFLVCIIIPLALLFIYQLYKFIVLVKDYKKMLIRSSNTSFFICKKILVFAFNNNC
ncbi:MAG: hypothetical protein L6V81_06250 [Clostridium sp.]|nr:MAG: hypothetical protein L6V81_06250 [Clostridium sp.]